MPSIESLYQQKEKAVDKCTISSELSTNNIDGEILEVRVEKLDEKMVTLKEAVELDDSETSKDPGSLLVLKIEDSEQNSGQLEHGPSSPEEQGEEASDVGEVSCENEKGTDKVVEKDEESERGTTKSSAGKWESIYSKICPGQSQAKNKLLKAKMSEILSKVLQKGDDLSRRLEAMSLGSDKNGLTSKGPVQAQYHQADMSPQYSPAYLHSPGRHGHLTSMSSPPHDSSMIPASIMNDMKIGSSPSEAMHTWVSNNYYPVSPPNSSYQSEHSLSDADYNNIAPQSPDDGPQDIPTVMAQAMHLIVPGENMPTASNQDVVNQWNYPSMSSSHDSGINCSVGRTDYDVQTWPGVESPSPASFHGNPPSVSSISEVDSVFAPSSPYNNSMLSPASASGGSAAQSPAPTPPLSTQWLPPQTSAVVSSEKLMTITASSNNNFGVVQVQQTTGSCSSPPQLFDDVSSVQQQIKHIEDYLKTPDMEPHHQQQTNLPSFNSTFSVSHPCKAPSLRALRPVSTFQTPYTRPSVASPPKSYTTMGPSQGAQLPTATTVVKRVQQQYSAAIEVDQLQTKSVDNRTYDPHPPLQPINQQQQHQQNAMRLTQEELLQKDCSDPYEGENLLQKLILEQRSGEAKAVIERMVQLGISLDATNDLGQSALLLAVINDMPTVVQYLVHYNADVLNGDKKGTYPIHYAASHGFTDVIQAICYSNRSIPLDCLDFNGKTPLMCAVEAHATHQTMYQDGEEVTRYVNNDMIAKILIDAGAQPTKQDARSGKTALHYAISDVKVDMIQTILEGDEMVKVARIPMYDGNTPLHLAVALKCDQTIKCDIIKYLIHKGADISATNVEKEKPIVLVTEGHKEVKECLDQFSKTRRR